MPGCETSVFSETTAFEASLREEGCLGLVTTGPGRFAARLTRVVLVRLNLAAAEERLSRIAFVAIPADQVLISFPLDDESRMIWGGIEFASGEIMTLGPGGPAHARTEGPCRWGSIRLPEAELAAYGGALLGAAPIIPSWAKPWRAPPAALRRLRELHAVAIRAAEARPATITGKEAAHGLEQQLIEPLVACLTAAGAGRNGPVRRRNQGLAARFEGQLRSGSYMPGSIAEICAALGVSTPVLRVCCEEQLGMSPARYLRLRRLQRFRRALLSTDAERESLAAVAERHGIRDLSRFIVAYRAFFGETPSVTFSRSQAGAPSRPRIPRRSRPGKIPTIH
jgi:AraC-like DNA-binding protein